jgi:hypothetical protein
MNRRQLLLSAAALPLTPLCSLANENEEPSLLKFFQPTDDKVKCVRKFIRENREDWNWVKDVGVFSIKYKDLDDLDIANWLTRVSSRCVHQVSTVDAVYAYPDSKEKEWGRKPYIISSHKTGLDNTIVVPGFNSAKYRVRIDYIIFAPYSFYRTDTELIVIDSFKIIDICYKSRRIYSPVMEEEIKWVS